MIVVPHCLLPVSEEVLSFITSKKVVSAMGSRLMNAIFWPFCISKFSLLKIVLPSNFLDKVSTFRISLPASLSCLKIIPGYFLLLAVISSNTNLSKAFLRLVACLLLEAFALKRAINSKRSFFFSSCFLFLSDACRDANCELSYQNV